MSYEVDEWVLEFARETAGTVFRLMRADKDRTIQEEALMEHAEAVKKAMDRAKFTDNSLVSIPPPESDEPESKG